MRTLLALMFLLSVVVAKDNFIYESNTKDCDKRLTEVETLLTQLKADQEQLMPLMELTEANRAGVAQNSKKIYDITVMNKNSNKKISDIASSLKSIKDILADSTRLMASQESREVIVTSPAPVVESMDLSAYAKQETLQRISVQTDNLMDRMSVLEKGMMEMERRPAAAQETGLGSVLGETRTALYAYFEYYVIATVVLFFMMFLIIFSLVSKTRRLHLAVEELAHRN